MANLVDVGQRGECRTDSAAARSPSRALGVCPFPLPALGRVESRAGAWAGAGGTRVVALSLLQLCAGCCAAVWPLAGCTLSSFVLGVV